MLFVPVRQQASQLTHKGTTHMSSAELKIPNAAMNHPLLPRNQQLNALQVGNSDCQECLPMLFLDHLRAVTITHHTGRFIAQDLRPFSVVENPEFTALVNVLERRYKMPWSQKVKGSFHKSAKP